MAKTHKTDWQRLRDEYVLGIKTIDPETGAARIYYPTHGELAEKYDLSRVRVASVAARDQWTKQKEIFQEKIRDHAQEKRLSVYMSDSAQIDALVLESVKDLMKIVRVEIEKISPVEPDKDGYEHDGEEVPVKIDDIVKLTKCLNELQSVGRRACGEPVGGISEEKMKQLKDATVINKTPETVSKSRIDELVKRRDNLNNKILAVRISDDEEE